MNKNYDVYMCREGEIEHTVATSPYGDKFIFTRPPPYISIHSDPRLAARYYPVKLEQATKSNWGAYCIFCIIMCLAWWLATL